MDVNKTLIAMSVAAALTAGFLPVAASAKKADEDDSVHRWGRWAVLAPAAGVEELPAFPVVAGNELGRCEADANCPQPQRQDTDDDKPDDDKPPVVGKPVGYARIDYRVSGSNQVYDRYVGDIGLKGDGTNGSMEFQVTGPSAPDGDNVDLQSGPLTVVAVGTDRFRSNPVGSLSALSGRYTRGADGEIALIDGTWRQVAADGAYNHSGQYFWGITATDAELAALKDQLRDPDGLPGQDIIAYYSGFTATGGSVVLDMNLSAATWSGSVDGLIVDFSTSGVIENAHFTANNFVLDSEISGDITGEMQGDLVNAGNNAIGGFTVEVVDYEREEVLREADVFNAGLQEPTAAVAAQ